jgi:hypothetical protein
MPKPQPPHKQVDLPMQVRSANFLPGTVNGEDRTVEMVWSTGATVRRRDWMTGDPYDEALSMDPGSVDLSRLNGGAPLLNSHNASALDSVLGVVEKAWIANGEGRATVRFSSRDEVASIFKDVQDGILRNVSVGLLMFRILMVRWRCWTGSLRQLSGKRASLELSRHDLHAMGSASACPPQQNSVP